MDAQGKYEYLLHTWGGFYNHKDQHGYKEGYFWFDTEAARDDYILELKDAEQRLNARHLVVVKEEGTRVRYRTVAKCVFVYRGKKYPTEYDFGFAYPAEDAEYMFRRGNYACDCNRSLFISHRHNDFEEMECGKEIELDSFGVDFVLDQSSQEEGAK